MRDTVLDTLRLVRFVLHVAGGRAMSRSPATSRWPAGATPLARSGAAGRGWRR
jgi:hypothetical protein